MITQTTLKENLFYNEDNGLFYWAIHRRRVKQGSVAGTVRKDGYIQIKVAGHFFLAHRLAWLYVHGEFPSLMIDHINQDKKDNRILNLRIANKSQNAQNTLPPRTNTSGYKGVSWNRHVNKWRASIKLNQVSKHLGFFDCKEMAHAAYLNASKQLHTHRCM